MNTRTRTSLAMHGIIVLLLGLLAGFPYALVLLGDLGGEARAWRAAHLAGILNGLVLLGIAAAGGLLALSQRRARALVISLLVAGYGNVAASCLGASFGVRGLAPTGPAANFVVFVLFTAAVIGVLLGLALAVLGALRALEAGAPST